MIAAATIRVYNELKGLKDQKADTVDVENKHYFTTDEIEVVSGEVLALRRELRWERERSERKFATVVRLFGELVAGGDKVVSF